MRLLVALPFIRPHIAHLYALAYALVWLHTKAYYTQRRTSYLKVGATPCLKVGATSLLEGRRNLLLEGQPPTFIRPRIAHLLLPYALVLATRAYGNRPANPHPLRVSRLLTDESYPYTLRADSHLEIVMGQHP